MFSNLFYWVEALIEWISDHFIWCAGALTTWILLRVSQMLQEKYEKRKLPPERVARVGASIMWVLMLPVGIYYISIYIYKIFRWGTKKAEDEHRYGQHTSVRKKNPRRKSGKRYLKESKKTNLTT